MGSLQARPLAAQALFSSVAGVLGTAGQGSYAAANGALDALAGLASAAGLAVQSIQWGPWSGVGMAAAHAELEGRLARQGYRMLSPQLGMAAFAEVLPLALRHPVVMASAFDWPTFLAHRQRAGQRPFSELPAAQPAGKAQRQAPAQPSSNSGVNGRQPDGRVTRGAMVEVVMAALEEVTGSAPPGESVPFSAAGIDSITSVELR